MPAYFVAIREAINDPEEMKMYGQKAAGTNAVFGGKPLVAYGAITVTEGDPIMGVVIIEFPDREKAEAWYSSPAYQEALPHRQRGATYRTFITDGLPGK